MKRFIIGLDLGQSQDWTALAIVERLKTHASRIPSPQRDPAQYLSPSEVSRREAEAIKAAEKVSWFYHLRHLERVPLGTTYPDVVTRVRALMSTKQLAGDTDLVVDATGVGQPVVDLLQAAQLHPTGVTITAGSVETSDRGEWRVPKRDLVFGLQVDLQNARLKVAEGLELWPVCMRELLAFKVKIDPLTANDSYGYAREGIHDDLVLALALACWRARKMDRAPTLPDKFVFLWPDVHRVSGRR